MTAPNGGRRPQNDGSDVDRDLNARVVTYLRDAPERAPDHLLAATTVRVHATPQSRRGLNVGRWRPGWVVVAAVIALAVIAPLWRGLEPGPGVGPSNLPIARTVPLGPAADPVVTQRTATSTTVRSVLVLGEDLWAVLVDGLVLRIDLATGEVVANLDAQLADPTGVAASSDAIWVGSNDGRLVRVDVASTAVESDIAVGIPHHAVAANDAAVWVAGTTGARRIDAGTLEITPFDLPAGVIELAVVGDDVWATYASGMIVVADGRSAEIKARIDGAIAAGRTQGGILVPGPSDVWLTDPRDGDALHRIDPGGPQIVGTVRFEPRGRPTSLAPDARGVWVLLGDEGLLVYLATETTEARQVIDVGLGGRGIGLVPGGLALWGAAGVRVIDIQGGG